jgi:esterase/lipase superfamily enzyme
MQIRLSTALALALWLGFATTSEIKAQPTIDEKTVLATCEALAAHDPQKIPPVVSRSAAEHFVAIYGGLSEPLAGCLSARQTESNPTLLTFQLQHTRYESYWQFSTDDQSITAISVERFRPVTLAEDEDWQYPFSQPATSATAGAESTESAPRHAHAAKKSGKKFRAPKKTNDVDVSLHEAPDPYVVEFFYATNRKEDSGIQTASIATADPNGWLPVVDYTGERDQAINFGAVRVRVPEGHHVGQIELPWKIFDRGDSGNDESKYFIIRSIQKTDEDQWIKSLSSSSKGKALVFVHGFNTKFRDAAFRTAQIIWDLQFHGTTVLFSWPSRGEMADYLYDKDSALGSRDALLHVIADLHKAGFDEVDVIAHSMGNLIAVDGLSNSAATDSPAKIAELVMAAPDVDRDLFIQDIPKVARIVKGLTLYADAHDRALALSKRVAGNIPRAGDVPPTGPVVLPSLVTIDVSVLGDEMFGLNHNVFATTRNVLDDLKILLDTGAPPPRLGEIRGYPAPPQSPLYYRYTP